MVFRGKRPFGELPFALLAAACGGLLLPRATGAQPSLLYDRLWYGVTALVARCYFVQDASFGPPVLRRPSWAPASLLGHARQLYKAFVRCILVLGLLLASSEVLVSLTPLRLAFAAAVAAADFVAFSSYGGHTGFVFVYTSIAMVLPVGPGRSGALRLIVAHQFGSSGLHKLRIGGRLWLHPSTMGYHLRFLHDQALPFKPHFLVEPPWLKQRWLIRMCLERTWVQSIMAWAGLGLELAVPVGCLFGGRQSLQLLTFSCCSFHILTAPLMGIIFPFSIPCYMISLLPPEAASPLSLLTVPAMIAAVLLGASSWLSLEDWPLNAMALFPFNREQAEVLASQMGRFMLAHRASSRSGASSGICLTEVCASICPANYWPEHVRAVGGPAFFKGEAAHRSDERVREELAKWVRSGHRFIDQRPDAGELRGRCFDDVVLVLERAAENGHGEK